MTNAVRITSVEMDGEDGLIVTFSDRTTGAYAVEDLLGLQILSKFRKAEHPWCWLEGGERRRSTQAHGYGFGSLSVIGQRYAEIGHSGRGFLLFILLNSFLSTHRCKTHLARQVQ